jgi:hypothetical protein
VHEKPVLLDLPLAADHAVGGGDDVLREFDVLRERTADILKRFQEEVQTVFKGTVIKVDDLQLALGKAVLAAQNRRMGSTLIPRFLKASKENDLTTSKVAVRYFLYQAERFARVIVSELREAPGSKLIGDAQIGGVARGKKFIAE